MSAVSAATRSADGASKTTSLEPTLVVVCLSTFMLLLNVSSPIVALPDIGRDLGASFTDLQWVLSAYALTLAALVLAAGALGDLVGRRRVTLIGLAVYAVASIGCVAASSPLMLIISRGIAGVGAGMLFATSLALLAGAYTEPAARARALGLWGATIGVAFAVGPVIGGAATEWASWRWAFAVNLPLCAAAAVIAAGRVRESRDPDAQPLDLPGAALLTVSLGALVFAVIRGNGEGWSSTLILSAFGLAVLSGAGFLQRERRCDHPLVDLRLFGRPTFTGSGLAALLTHASTFALTIFIVQFLLRVHGSGPLAAGLQVLPYAGVASVVSIMSPRLSWAPRRSLAVGLTLASIGSILLTLAGTDSSWTALLPGLLIAGLGVGLVNPALAASALSEVAPPHAGMAAGVNNTFRQLGTAVGIAGLGSILEQHLQRAGQGESSYTDGFHTLCLVAAAVAAVGALLSLSLVGREVGDGKAPRRDRAEHAPRSP